MDDHALDDGNPKVGNRVGSCSSLRTCTRRRMVMAAVTAFITLDMMKAMVFVGGDRQRIDSHVDRREEEGNALTLFTIIL